MKKRWASLLAMLLVLTMLCGAWAEAEDSAGEQSVTWDEEADFCEPEEAPEELDEFELGDETVGEEPLDEAYENSVVDEFSQYADIEWGTEGTVDPDAAGADTPAMGNVTIGDYTYSFDGGTASVVKYNGTAASVTLPTSVSYDGIVYRIKTLGMDAFSGNASLRSITIPSCYTSIGWRTFKNCYNLSSVTINGDLADCEPDSANADVCDWRSPFYAAGKNTSGIVVTFGNGVTRIPGYIFAVDRSKDSGSYAKVTRVIMPNTVTSIGNAAFYDCYDLTAITWSTNLQSIGGTAFINTGIAELTLPDKVTSLGYKTFSGCLYLKRITLPASLTKLDTNTFAYCTNLNSLTIKGDIENCHGNPFYRLGQNTDGLTLHIASGVTRIPYEIFAVGGAKSNGNYAKITTVYLPKTLKDIGKDAFLNCYDIADVYYDGSKFGFDKITIGSGNDCLLNARIHYAIVTGWQRDSKGRWYVRDDGSYPRSTFEYIDDNWYFFGEDGYMVIGWRKIGGKYFYFRPNGTMVTGWQQISGKWYYFQTSGEMATGWTKIGGKWYYFANGGAMLTGWQKLGGRYYYFKAGGEMMTGWMRSGNTRYYFMNNGAMATGWLKIDGDWYYFKSDGAMTVDWMRVGSKWYYFNSDGVMATGWQKINGREYHFLTDGTMATGWQMVGGNWHYYKTDGTETIGWMRDGHIWYYFDGNGIMATGWKRISGKQYYFMSSGVMTTGWLKEGGFWYYFQSNGVMKTGWMRSGNNWYYFDPSDGVMATGRWRIDGKYYGFNSNGVLTTWP